MTTRKVLTFENACECGHRSGGRCEHPECPDSDGICPPAIASWCPLQDAEVREKLEAGKYEITEELVCNNCRTA